MPDQPSLILLARTRFDRGDLGWLTRGGVIRATHETSHPEGILLVRALDAIEAGHYGRFVDISVTEH